MPNLEIVMLTAYEEEDNIFRALKQGDLILVQSALVRNGCLI
jgi:hypothetical protein